MSQPKRPKDLVCPNCQKENHDRKLVLFEDGNIFCNSCGVTTFSPQSRENFKPKKFEFDPKIYKGIDINVIKRYFTYGATHLHNFIFKTFDNEIGFNHHGLGRDPRSGRTAFLYQDIYQRYRYVKCVQYMPNGKRDKNSNPFAPYTSSQGYKACLYGEHLLKDHKGSVCLVESEKTSIIASIQYPNQVWLATGGSNGLTYDKAQHLRGRTVYKYVDCDEAGRNVKNDRKKLDYFNANLVVKDVAPEREDGSDIADLILEQL